MAQDAQIIFTPGSVPPGFCPATEQERFNLYATLLSGVLPGTYSTFIVSSSQPTVDQQSFPWIKVNADGSLIGIYTFANGAWVRPHPVLAGPNAFRTLWVGSTGDLATYDGGDAGAITSTTGAFWEVDTDWTDKIVIGAGANAAVSTNANQLTSGSSSTDQVRGSYIIKRSARVYYIG